MEDFYGAQDMKTLVNVSYICTLQSQNPRKLFTEDLSALHIRRWKIDAD